MDAELNPRQLTRNSSSEIYRQLRETLRHIYHVRTRHYDPVPDYSPPNLPLINRIYERFCKISGDLEVRKQFDFHTIRAGFKLRFNEIQVSITSLIDRTSTIYGHHCPTVHRQARDGRGYAVNVIDKQAYRDELLFEIVIAVANASAQPYRVMVDGTEHPNCWRDM